MEAADRLRESFRVEPDGFRVLLIAKDDGVKLNCGKPVAARHLFQ